MASNSRFIELSLLTGQPDGMRTGEIHGGTAKALEFRREELKDVKTGEGGKKNVGVYVLVGRSLNRPQGFRAYVGCSGKVWSRLITHDEDTKKNNVFWEETSVFIDDKFSKSHAEYLESLLFYAIKVLPDWELANTAQPSKDAGQLDKNRREIVAQRLEEAITIFDALGSRVFRAMKEHESEKSTKTNTESSGRRKRPNPGYKRKPNPKKPDKNHTLDSGTADVIFESKGKNHDAQMKIDQDNNIVICKNSTVTAEIISLQNKQTNRINDLKERYKNEGVLQKEDNKYRVKKDIILSSLSDSTVFVSGYRSSSSLFWKYYDQFADKFISFGEFKNRKSYNGSAVFSFGKEKFEASMVINSDNECTILKDSKASKEHGNSANNKLIADRENLVKDGVLKMKGDFLVFCKDYMIDSPNKAAAVVAGYGVNAMNSWRLPDGTPLGVWKSSKGKNNSS